MRCVYRLLTLAALAAATEGCDWMLVHAQPPPCNGSAFGYSNGFGYNGYGYSNGYSFNGNGFSNGYGYNGYSNGYTSYQYGNPFPTYQRRRGFGVNASFQFNGGRCGPFGCR